MLLCSLTARDQHALGELEREQMRREIRPLEGAVDVFDELRMLKLTRRDVDRDLEVATEELTQTRRVEAGLEQHPAADRHDQS